MYIFFADESNANSEDVKKYGLTIYGGLILTPNQAKDLTNFFYKLKDSYVLPQELDLKWRPECVWDNMKKIGYISKELTKTNKPELYKSIIQDYNTLKERVLDRISNSEVKIVIAIRPNKLLNSSDVKNIEYSIGAVAKKFRKILKDENKTGIIMADELRKKLKTSDVINYQYILKLNCLNKDYDEVDNLFLIVPTIDSCVSPIHQINDIVLGCIQYYLLGFMRKLESADHEMSPSINLLGKISNKFYKKVSTDYVINNGILLYPPKNSRKDTRAGSFLDKLEAQLKTDFNIK